MESDQGVIIEFLWKERTDTRDIPAIRQAQFAEHAYHLQMI
jgi:hypothetical protein